jgi:hypothetical protein
MTQIVLDSKSPQHRHRGSATAFVLTLLLLVFAMLRLTYTPEVPDAQLHRTKHYDEFASLKRNPSSLSSQSISRKRDLYREQFCTRLWSVPFDGCFRQLHIGHYKANAARQRYAH